MILRVLIFAIFYEVKVNFAISHKLNFEIHLRSKCGSIENELAAM